MDSKASIINEPLGKMMLIFNNKLNSSKSLQITSRIR